MSNAYNNLFIFLRVVLIRGGKVSLNSFAHLNPPTLIEPKPTQLLVGLNEHQTN